MLVSPWSCTSSRRSLLAVKVRKRAFTRFTTGRSSSHKIFARQIFCGSPGKSSLRSRSPADAIRTTLSLLRVNGLAARLWDYAYSRFLPSPVGGRCRRKPTDEGNGSLSGFGRLRRSSFRKKGEPEQNETPRNALKKLKDKKLWQ